MDFERKLAVFKWEVFCRVHFYNRRSPILAHPHIQTHISRVEFSLLDGLVVITWGECEGSFLCGDVGIWLWVKNRYSKWHPCKWKQ